MGHYRHFHHNPDEVTYGRVRGSALEVRDEVRAVWEAISAVKAGQCYRSKARFPLDPTMNEKAAIGCNDLRVLQNRLSADDRPDLQVRVNDLRGHFKKAVEYTRRAGEVKNLGGFKALLDEMVNGDSKVLPDIYIVNGGIRFCDCATDCKFLLDCTKTHGIPVGNELFYKWMEVSIPVDADWKKHQELFEEAVDYGMPVNMDFFNRWLATPYSFQQIGWVCNKAKERGFPNLNNKSREILRGLIFGRHFCVDECPGTSGITELHSLRRYFVCRNAEAGKDGIWEYLIEIVDKKLDSDGRGRFAGDRADFYRMGRPGRRIIVGLHRTGGDRE